MELDDGIFIVWLGTAISWCYLFIVGLVHSSIGLITITLVGVATFSYGLAIIKQVFAEKTEEWSTFKSMWVLWLGCADVVVSCVIFIAVPLYILGIT